MRRWWIALGVVVGLGVVLLLAVILLIDAESFRGPIEKALAENTGWNAEIGELDFSIFRGMVVTVRAVELSAPGDTSFARVDTLEVEARFWPLLSGEIYIDGITLDGPEVRLVRTDVGALPLKSAAAAHEVTRRGATNLRVVSLL